METHKRCPGYMHETYRPIQFHLFLEIVFTTCQLTKNIESYTERLRIYGIHFHLNIFPLPSE